MTNQAKRKSFIIHKDSLSVLKKLNTEQKASLFDAIANYQIDSKLPEDNFISIIFEPFLNQFLRDEENYAKTCEARRIAGGKGGKQKVANASKSKQKVANLADSDSKSDSDSDNKNDIKEISSLRSDTKKKFIKPTLQEIQTYCQERKNSVNPEKWLNHYESNGWKVGKNPMKDWKAAVRTWESNSQNFNNKPVSKHSNFEEQDYYAGTEGFLINDEEL